MYTVSFECTTVNDDDDDVIDKCGEPLMRFMPTRTKFLIFQMKIRGKQEAELPPRARVQMTVTFRNKMIITHLSLLCITKQCANRSNPNYYVCGYLEYFCLFLSIFKNKSAILDGSVKRGHTLFYTQL